MNHEGFAEGDDTLLGSRDATLEEEEVVLYDTVMGETTQWGDGLLRNVMLGGGVVVVFTKANTIDLLVDLRSMVVTICNTKVLLKRIKHKLICAYFDQHARRRT